MCHFTCYTLGLIHILSNVHVPSSLDKGGNLADKAKEAVNNPEASLDAILEKAKGLANDIEEKVKNSGGELSDKIGYEELNKSTLEGKDDFFAKADRYAKGDFKKEGEINIVDVKEGEAVDKEPFKGDIHGFNDLDGDGDPLIDDAIIEE